MIQSWVAVGNQHVATDALGHVVGILRPFPCYSATHFQKRSTSLTGAHKCMRNDRHLIGGEHK